MRTNFEAIFGSYKKEVGAVKEYSTGYKARKAKKKKAKSAYKAVKKSNKAENKTALKKFYTKRKEARSTSLDSAYSNQRGRDMAGVVGLAGTNASKADPNANAKRKSLVKRKLVKGAMAGYIGSSAAHVGKAKRKKKK